MSDPETRVMLITGAAGGIGRATVLYFANRGWQVIGVDRAEFGEGFPTDGLFIRADNSLENEVREVYKRVKGFSDTLDVVINNAAIQNHNAIVDTDAEEWDNVLASNLRPVYLHARWAHPFLKASKAGAIVNVSSVHAVSTSKNIAAYAASKGGILALTRAMAIEFAPDNIRVNAILPGAVDTPMLRASMVRGLTDGTVSERLENLARKTVNGRIAQPEEISSVIYFLADSSMSSFMTGQALVVDGGATARLSTE
jgi:NAD(P)-dependent dehydrogenase (short-subunit alcohol dehydrogenase family)